MDEVHAPSFSGSTSKRFCRGLLQQRSLCFEYLFHFEMHTTKSYIPDNHEDVVVQASSFRCWKRIDDQWSWKCPGRTKCEARLIREGRNRSLLPWAAFPLVRCRHRVFEVGSESGVFSLSMRVWWKAPQVCFNLLNNACHKGSSPEFIYPSIWSNRITCSWMNHSRMRARCVDRHPPRAQWKRLGEKESNSMGAGTTRTMPANNLWTPTRWFDKNNK